jgi:hypothetical protein
VKESTAQWSLLSPGGGLALIGVAITANTAPINGVEKV